MNQLPLILSERVAKLLRIREMCLPNPPTLFGLPVIIVDSVPVCTCGRYTKEHLGYELPPHAANCPLASGVL